MKYLMILLMSVGLCTFSMAQDNNNWDAKAPHDESMDNSSLNESGSSSSSSSAVIQPGMVEKEQVTTVNTTEEKNGLAGTIVKAPFKFVGYTVYGVGKGVGTIGKGVVKGTGRIVAAPFRAIGKAFDRNKRTEVTEVTTTDVNVTPSEVIETESSSTVGSPTPEMNSSENVEIMEMDDSDGNVEIEEIDESKAPMDQGSM